MKSNPLASDGLSLGFKNLTKTETNQDYKTDLTSKQLVGNIQKPQYSPVNAMTPEKKDPDSPTFGSGGVGKYKPSIYSSTIKTSGGLDRSRSRPRQVLSTTKVEAKPKVNFTSEKRDPILDNLPVVGSDSKRRPGLSRSSKNVAMDMTAAPSIESLTKKSKPFDPIGDSAIPSFTASDMTKKRLRPRMKTPDVFSRKSILINHKPKQEAPKEENTEKKTEVAPQVIVVVTGENQDAKEAVRSLVCDNPLFKELKSKVGFNDSYVISDSPTSTKVDSQIGGSSKYVQKISAFDNKDVKEKQIPLEKNIPEEIIAEKPQETEKIEKSNEVKEETKEETKEEIKEETNEDKDTAKINEILKSLKTPIKDGLTSESVVKFHCESLADAEILFEASKLDFPKIKELQMTNMHELMIEEDIKGCNDLMGVSIRHPLDAFTISTGEFDRICKFKFGLQRILSLVNHQVTISGFTIDAKMLDIIFENCRKVDTLVLEDCRIDVDTTYQLPYDISFNIQKLRLSKTKLSNSSIEDSEKDFDIIVDEFSKACNRLVVKN